MSKSKETAVSVTLNGITYIGTFREDNGWLVIGGAYGAKSVPAGRAMTDLKAAARLVLTSIVNT
jgi:hypothetical protein